MKIFICEEIKQFLTNYWGAPQINPLLSFVIILIMLIIHRAWGYSFYVNQSAAVITHFFRFRYAIINS